MVFEHNGWYLAELVCKDKQGDPHTEKTDIRPVTGELFKCAHCGGWRQVMAVSRIEIPDPEKCTGAVKINGEFNPPQRITRHYGKYGYKRAKEKKRKRPGAVIIRHDGRMLSEFERNNLMSRPDLIRVEKSE